MFTDSGNQDKAQSLCWVLSGIRFLCELFIKWRRRRSPVPDIDSQPDIQQCDEMESELFEGRKVVP